MDKWTSMVLIAIVGTNCNQAYITIEDTAGTAGLQRFCGNVLSDTDTDTTAGAVTSKYLSNACGQASSSLACLHAGSTC